MNIYQPYTYLLKFKPTGQVYYGVSYINHYRGKAHPSQLWNTYFSSSKYVKELIKIYGQEMFDVQVRKVFVCREDAIKWEHKVLKNLMQKTIQCGSIKVMVENNLYLNLVELSQMKPERK